MKPHQTSLSTEEYKIILQHGWMLVFSALVPLTKLCVFFHGLLLPDLKTFGRRGLEVIIPFASHVGRMWDMI